MSKNLKIAVISITVLILILGIGYFLLQNYISDYFSSQPAAQKNEIGSSDNHRMVFLQEQAPLFDLDIEPIVAYENDSGCSSKNYGWGQGVIETCYYRIVKEYEDSNKEIFSELKEIARELNMEEPMQDKYSGEPKFRKKVETSYLYVCIDRYTQQDKSINTVITFTDGGDTSCTEYGYN